MRLNHHLTLRKNAIKSIFAWGGPFISFLLVESSCGSDLAEFGSGVVLVENCVGGAPDCRAESEPAAVVFLLGALSSTIFEHPLRGCAVSAASRNAHLFWAFLSPFQSESPSSENRWDCSTSNWSSCCRENRRKSILQQ